MFGVGGCEGIGDPIEGPEVLQGLDGGDPTPELDAASPWPSVWPWDTGMVAREDAATPRAGDNAARTCELLDENRKQGVANSEKMMVASLNALREFAGPFCQTSVRALPMTMRADLQCAARLRADQGPAPTEASQQIAVSENSTSQELYERLDSVGISDGFVYELRIAANTANSEATLMQTFKNRSTLLCTTALSSPFLQIGVGLDKTYWVIVLWSKAGFGFRPPGGEHP